ncbi:hypothetical protein HPP92_025818 [Vanilla planifolia]|uniref:Uncharacterized protein n=1 Tax=Vanilla planifolia TaxID=51239 RepID=A0A835PHA5_VANPL|nr:hypothetical protein HPP92_025818 [Vanilla planifolia]
MTLRLIDDPKYLTSTSASIHSLAQHSCYSPTGNRNICQLLSQREISPRTKRFSKKIWGEASKWSVDCTGLKKSNPDARQAIISWVEAESLRHLSAKYCPLLPPPRSTIAAAFSSDGKTLASTHGDHTVKIIDCRTGRCLKVLSGHERTPWVVRFHPLYPEILASGSLDHEVRIWDAHTADCIGSRDFLPSYSFCSFSCTSCTFGTIIGEGNFFPTIVLKTRRSLRAVHFHPHGAPFLLTAEVIDFDSPDSSLTLSTTSGYLQYPPPAVLFTNMNSSLRSHLESKVPLIPSPYLLCPTFQLDDSSTALQNPARSGSSMNGHQKIQPNRQQESLVSGSQLDTSVRLMEISPAETRASTHSDSGSRSITTRIEASNSGSCIGNMDTTNGQPNSWSQSSFSYNSERADITSSAPVALKIPERQTRGGIERDPVINSSNSTNDIQMHPRNVEGQVQHFCPLNDSSSWELPFWQGWLMGQSHAGLQSLLSASNHGTGSNLLADLSYNHNVETLIASSMTVPSGSHSRSTGRSGARNQTRCQAISSAGVGALQPEIPSLTAAATAELPCTVKLRIWPHNIRDPCAFLDAETCRLTIPHAVLCSEMGAHFSPCGRFLVACVACMVHNLEGDPGLQSQVNFDAADVANSPTRHPISAHQVMYELRVYSLEEATFGSVLASRAIRAAHCLTSIQFSPTSEHILLAYGRRHSSLLRSILIDGETAIPIYTILEVYRVSDMELVRVLPSAEDEVNVACFHPLSGGGLVYGTKEGKLRILHYDGPQEINFTGSKHLTDENMLEATFTNISNADLRRCPMICSLVVLALSILSIYLRSLTRKMQKWQLMTKLFNCCCCFGAGFPIIR